MLRFARETLSSLPLENQNVRENEKEFKGSSNSDSPAHCQHPNNISKSPNLHPITPIQQSINSTGTLLTLHNQTKEEEGFRRGSCEEKESKMNGGREREKILEKRWEESKKKEEENGKEEENRKEGEGESQVEGIREREEHASGRREEEFEVRKRKCLNNLFFRTLDTLSIARILSQFAKILPLKSKKYNSRTCHNSFIGSILFPFSFFCCFSFSLRLSKKNKEGSSWVGLLKTNFWKTKFQQMNLGRCF